MAKFHDKVGYLETRETSADVYSEVITERTYKGELIRDQRRYQASESLNDDIVLSNSISIIADSYAYEHAFAIRYVRYKGILWKVTNIEIQRPRIILTIGGRYNVQES